MKSIIPPSLAHAAFNADEKIATIEQDLLSTIREQLQAPQLTAKDHFFNAGGTSRQALALLEYIHRTYGLELKFITLFRYPTAHQLAHILHGHENPAQTPTLFPMRTTGDAQCVLAFVGTRGFVFLDYLALAAEINPDIDVVYLDWKDLDRDQYLQTQVDSFAQQYHQLLVEYCGEKSLFLAGICDGTLIATETVALFPPENRPSVIILDTRAHAPERNQLEYYRQRFRLFMSHPWQVKWEKIKKHFRLQREKINYTPMERRSAQEGKRSWVGGLPMKPVPSNIHLLRGKDSEINMNEDPSLGWKSLTQGNFSLNWIPGTHDTLFNEINVEEVAEAINQILKVRTT